MAFLNLVKSITSNVRVLERHFTHRWAIYNYSYLPHPMRSLLLTYPELQITSDETCSNEDLLAVLLIPSKAITNCPVETAYFIWKSIASLFSPMVSFVESESKALTDTEKKTTFASVTACLFLSSAVQPHPGTVTSFILQELGLRHPWIVPRVSPTSCSKEERNCSYRWLPSQGLISRIDILKWCFISLGIALPGSNKNLD